MSKSQELFNLDYFLRSYEHLKVPATFQYFFYTTSLNYWIFLLYVYTNHRNV